MQFDRLTSAVVSNAAILVAGGHKTEQQRSEDRAVIREAVLDAVQPVAGGQNAPVFNMPVIIDAFRVLTDNINARFAEVNARFGEVNVSLGEVNARLDNFNARIGSLETHVKNAGVRFPEDDVYIPAGNGNPPVPSGASLAQFRATMRTNPQVTAWEPFLGIAPNNGRWRSVAAA